MEMGERERWQGEGERGGRERQEGSWKGIEIDEAGCDLV
jgi:hypothetical protein